MVPKHAPINANNKKRRFVRTADEFTVRAGFTYATFFYSHYVRRRLFAFPIIHTRARRMYLPYNVRYAGVVSFCAVFRS